MNKENTLIDVWKIEYEGEYYFAHIEPNPDDLEGVEVITKMKMDKEQYNHLPEFSGF